MIFALPKASLVLLSGVVLASVGCVGGGGTIATPTPIPTAPSNPTPVPPTVLFSATGVTGFTATGNLNPVAGKQLTVSVYGASLSTDLFEIRQNGVVVVPFANAPTAFVTTPSSNAVVNYSVTQAGTGTYNVTVSQVN